MRNAIRGGSRRFQSLAIVTVAVAATVTVLAPTTALAAAPVPVTGTTVASWPMKETSGSSAYDATGRGHTATLYAGKPSFNFINDVTLNRYVGNYPTDNGLLLVNASADLSPGAANFAFGLTFKTTDAHSNIMQAGTTQAGKDFVKYEMASARSLGLTGVPRCHFTGDVSRDAGGYILLAGKSYADGLWHTVRCDKYTNMIVMRVDNVVVNSRAVTVGSINVSLSKWSLGGKYAPNQIVSTYDMYKGQLRDVFVIIAR